MAQFVDESTERVVQDTKMNLQTHLSKYNVPDRVYELLEEESITVDELITFRANDLDDWCNEHSLKTIERRRFLNAVNSLKNENNGNNVNNSNTKAQPARLVFVGNEEKEQINQFNQMSQNVQTMINCANNINENSTKNINVAIKEINVVCDKIESFVKQLRQNLLAKVCLQLAIRKLCKIYI